jgi:hypothetical protein
LSQLRALFETRLKQISSKTLQKRCVGFSDQNKKPEGNSISEVKKHTSTLVSADATQPVNNLDRRKQKSHFRSLGRMGICILSKYSYVEESVLLHKLYIKPIDKNKLE